VDPAYDVSTGTQLDCDNGNGTFPLYNSAFDPNGQDSSNPFNDPFNTVFDYTGPGGPSGWAYSDISDPFGPRNSFGYFINYSSFPWIYLLFLNDVINAPSGYWELYVLVSSPNTKGSVYYVYRKPAIEWNGCGSAVFGLNRIQYAGVLLYGEDPPPLNLCQSYPSSVVVRSKDGDKANCPCPCFMNCPDAFNNTLYVNVSNYLISYQYRTQSGGLAYETRYINFLVSVDGNIANSSVGWSTYGQLPNSILNAQWDSNTYNDQNKINNLPFPNDLKVLAFVVTDSSEFGQSGVAIYLASVYCGSDGSVNFIFLFRYLSFTRAILDQNGNIVLVPFYGDNTFSQALLAGGFAYMYGSCDSYCNATATAEQFIPPPPTDPFGTWTPSTATAKITCGQPSNMLDSNTIAGFHSFWM